VGKPQAVSAKMSLEDAAMADMFFLFDKGDARASCLITDPFEALQSTFLDTPVCKMSILLENKVFD
jgi:hypothetical protein